MASLKDTSRMLLFPLRGSAESQPVGIRFVDLEDTVCTSFFSRMDSFQRPSEADSKSKSFSSGHGQTEAKRRPSVFMSETAQGQGGSDLGPVRAGPARTRAANGSLEKD